MSKLFICSEPDLPSVNMRAQLLDAGGWEEIPGDDACTLHRKEDVYIMSVPGLHIRQDRIDETAAARGIEADTVVFMSKHASASGDPTLTVHPIGNYNDNRLGGRERTLVPANPPLMTDALRLMDAYCDIPGFAVCFEVTHHGPWLDKPTFFIEIGSDERNWGDIGAACLLARVLTEMRENDYPDVIGVGGGHYAPRFTEMALKHKVNFGHMVPWYQLEGHDDEDILRMVGDAAAMTGTDAVYIHRNSLGKPMQRRVHDLIVGAGYEIVRSADLDPLSPSDSNR